MRRRDLRRIRVNLVRNRSGTFYRGSNDAEEAAMTTPQETARTSRFDGSGGLLITILAMVLLGSAALMFVAP